MKQYVGLDVSMEESKIRVLDEEGGRVWRGKCRSEPGTIAATIHKRASEAVRIGIETGPLTTWLYTELVADGLPMVCLDARHAKKALDMKVNKTDANDAEGLAHLVRSGWYREVRVKVREAMRVKALTGARSQLLGMSTELSNQIRGIMKTFGLVVPKGQGGVFERNVSDLLAGGTPSLASSCPSSMRGAPCAPGPLSSTASSLPRARQSTVCRLLMTMPGIGTVTAASYAAAIETPDNFAHSRDVGTWVGLTPRRFRIGRGRL